MQPITRVTPGGFTPAPFAQKQGFTPAPLMPRPLAVPKITSATPITQVRETAPIPQANRTELPDVFTFTAEETRKAKLAKEAGLGLQRIKELVMMTRSRQANQAQALEANKAKTPQEANKQMYNQMMGKVGLSPKTEQNIKGGLISSATDVGQFITSKLDKPIEGLAKTIGPVFGKSKAQVEKNIESVKAREQVPIGARVAGSDPESMAYIGSELAGDIGKSILLDKGVRGIPAIGAKLQALHSGGKVAKLAGGVAEGVLGAGSYALAGEQRLPTAQEVGYGGAFGAAIPAIPMAVAGAGKKINELGNKLYLSGILNPKKLEYAQNALRETGDKIDNVVGRMASKDIKGSKSSIVKQLQQTAKTSRTEVKRITSVMKGTVQNKSIGGAIDEMIDILGNPSSVKQQKKLDEITSLKQKHDTTGLDDTTGLERKDVQKIKEEMDKITSIYTIAGDVKAGAKKEDLAGLRFEIRKLIEDEAAKQGYGNIGKLNRDTAVAVKLAEGINYKDGADYVRDMLSPFAGPALGGIAGGFSGDSLEERIKNAVVGAILGKVVQSTRLKTNSGLITKKIGQWMSSLSGPEKNIFNSVFQKIDDITTTNRTATSSNISDNIDIDSIIDSIPGSRAVVDKFAKEMDELQKLKALPAPKPTPITPTGTIKNPNPVSPVPLLPKKKTVIEKGRATHDPYPK